eukprot:TRINITY_DN9905_c0_g1_i2.p1 TRINITY_DN9905_c0_g1~~TRINITY_DN9905_c0_g1_i2.p1  ORF type:complete len:131 (+),score=22.88 TRINITY_DN9905_c0_g1_i2:50-442(+)
MHTHNHIFTLSSWAWFKRCLMLHFHARHDASNALVDDVCAYRFSKTKHGIGYEPFVEECLNNKRPPEAAKYIAKLPKDQRVHYYLRAGKYNEAIETAVALRSEEDLERIVQYGHAHGRRDIDRMVAEATQ